ncbi:unnamed protein product [Schistosoma rodhaini]|uniref:Transcription initiation factor tfiid 55 kD subunit-related n=1 Tax=Schistosoma mansoni TaxID=6183 RepID=A0A3Q0KSV8_SCHMA|nr:unnamed protein product [Schistosoma rodhaini]
MNAKLPLDSNYDLEQQFILRMTDTVAAQNLAADIDAGIPFKENFTVEFKPDMRHTIVRYNGQVYQGQIMDLPCIIESLKTTDKKNFYKTANICQMMICTQGDETGPLRGTAAYLDNRPGSRNKTFDISHENREFQFLHGITPPLKNVLHRRFRKTRRKRFVDMPKIEKEVKQLLRADLQAVNVKWEVIWTDPPAPVIRSNANNNKSGLSNNETDNSNNVQSGNQQRTADDELEDEEDEDGGRAYAIDHRDVFGEISSSSIGSSSDSDDNSSSSSHRGNGGGGADRHRHEGGRGRERLGSSDHPSDNDEHADVGDGKVKDYNQSSARNQTTDNSALVTNQSTSETVYNKLKSTIITSTTNDLSTDVISATTSIIPVDNLKDELAAELLLSDSGDEQADSVGVVDVDDDDLQTSVVTELIANSTNKNSINMQHLHNTTINNDDCIVTGTITDLDNLVDVVVNDGNDVDEDDDDEERNNIIHRGGELLDDNSFMGFTNTTTQNYYNDVFNADIDDEDTS